MYELLDTPTPEPLPQMLSDLTLTQMKLLVDAYAVGNVITMRQATYFPTWICRETFDRLERLKNLVLGYIRANEETTKTDLKLWLVDLVLQVVDCQMLPYLVVVFQLALLVRVFQRVEWVI